ncbi:hypothetical protein [Microbacterium sp. Ag1]|uniref:hypothetical protein n=1 Tax=Microbacterium sp. Ag1 TaxID=1643443 RepID=UPI0012E0815D|nr:hypothetical protein [Microbacterium sp. Ag1]
MGTQKQADALIKIARQTGRVFTPEQLEMAKAQVLAMDHASIQAMFAEYNAKTGFNRDYANASDSQLLLIGRLEKKLYGTVTPFKEKRHLTFTEADAKIKTLNSLLQMEKAA